MNNQTTTEAKARKAATLENIRKFIDASMPLGETMTLIRLLIEQEKAKEKKAVLENYQKSRCMHGRCYCSTCVNCTIALAHSREEREEK